MAEQGSPGWQQTSLLSLVPPQEQPLVPQRLLILDTETSGLDPERHQCLEVGAILFSVPQRAVLAQLSFLIPAASNAAEALNGIAPAATQEPQPWQQSLALLEALASQAQLLVAHNAAFDRAWFGRGALPKLPLPWLCSMEDISWPAQRQLRPRPVGTVSTQSRRVPLHRPPAPRDRLIDE